MKLFAIFFASPSGRVANMYLKNSLNVSCFSAFLVAILYLI